MPLSKGGGLRLTVAKYYLPSGETIENIGVVPDIKVEQKKDKTAHAEMLIIQKLRKKFGTTHFFGLNVSVYVTLEPCCMCVSALAMCGVQSVFYMLEDKKFGGVNKVFVNSAYFMPNFYLVYNEEYRKIIHNFFQGIRG
jgi:tRNA(Arg) A34 adenosine deaminase TadA